MNFIEILERPVRLAEINPGQQITGVTSLIAYDELYDALFTYVNKNCSGRIDDLKSLSTETIISNFLAKNKFYGQIRDLKVTMVGTDIANVTGINRSPNLLNLVTEGQMYSTGRGNVGTYVFQSRYSFTYSNQIASRFQLFHRGLKTPRDLGFLDDLQQESQAIGLATYRDHIHHTLIGGTMTSKRR